MPSASTSKDPCPQSPRFQMKPVSSSMATLLSLPVTGFFSVSPAARATPGISTVLCRPASWILMSDRTTPATSKVVPRISQGIPPSWPVKICARAPSCSSVTAGGTTNTALPPPSWIALGQSRMPATVMPERSTSPQRPLSMTLATNALQLPSEDVGNPEKLQVQPGLQLQNS
jgi:hypothetical protein